MGFASAPNLFLLFLGCRRGIGTLSFAAGLPEAISARSSIRPKRGGLYVNHVAGVVLRLSFNQ